MNTLNVDLSITNWFAISRAAGLGFTRTAEATWTSDVEMRTQTVPPDVTVIWEVLRLDGHYIVLEDSDSVIQLEQDRRNYTATVYGKSQENNRATLDTLKEKFPCAERASNLLDVTFWYNTANGPRSYDRQLEAPSWAEIEGNYPSNTRTKLQDLLDTELDKSSGKLILWQGEPGTGKSFALRALAEEWASWCRVHYVIDPEKFFTEGDYLLSVILGRDEPSPSTADQRPMWRLVVLEDAGEMLAKDAKMQVGQGLARLLNLCDGLLGQGLRVLVLITTNEQIGSLHGAVSRKGRCLSQVNFEKFDGISAARWLESHGKTAAAVRQVTLADLYALSNGEDLQPKKVAGY